MYDEAKRVAKDSIFFVVLGARYDPINVNKYIIRTLDDFFPWAEPESSCSKEDRALERERMRRLLDYIPKIAPIVLILVGNKESVASGRTNYFVENLPFHRIGYHAFIEYERVKNKIKENISRVLNVYPKHLDEFQLRSLAETVSDTSFSRCLLESGRTLEERNDKLDYFCAASHGSAAEDIPGHSDQVTASLVFLRKILECIFSFV